MPFDFPSNPTTGQTVTASTGVVYRWDGVRWLPVANAFQGAVVIADTPPATPPVGELWFDSTGLQTYVRFNDGTSTQWVPVINQNSAPGEAPTTGAAYARQNSAWVPTSQSNVGRNLLHNAQFNVQQRGAGPWTASGAYSADRWTSYINVDTCSTSIVTLADADRTAIGDEAARSGLQCVVAGSANTGAQTILIQFIEDARRLSGKTLTVSFWAKASVAGLKIGVGGWMDLGTGGTAGGQGVPGVSVPVGTAWSRVSATLKVPSLVTYTVSTTDSKMELDLYLSEHNASQWSGGLGTQSGTFTFWGVQLEVGPVATTLEKLDPRLDLANCQRFYQTGYVNFVGYQSAGSGFTATGYFPTTMRNAPTTTLFATTLLNSTSISVTGAGVQTIIIQAVATAAAPTGVITSFTASADL